VPKLVRLPLRAAELVVRQEALSVATAGGTLFVVKVISSP
jgi:hypothetical protein